MPTQVLILAAGRGSRLGPRTADIPKPLLQVGPRTLIEHQLEMFAEAGVGPVGMVLGYQADEIAEVVGIRAEYVLNHRWSTTNSLFSFVQARSWVNGDLIVANCDILLHPRILARLLAAGGDAFAFDSTSGEGLEHMKVQLDGGSLVRMSKSLDPAVSCGENVGLLHLRSDTVERLFDIAERMLSTGREKDWLGVAVQELARERTLTGVDVAGLPWAEIDFAYDLDRARKVVWPEIRGRAATRRRTLVLRVAAAAAAVALIGMAGSPLPASSPGAGVDWETIPVDGATGFTLEAGEIRQRWWLLPAGAVLEAELNGSRGARIESRVLLPEGVTAMRYRVRVDVEGEPPRSLRYEGRMGGAASHAGRLASAPVYEHIRPSRRSARLRIEGDAAGGSPVLIRVREAVIRFADEEPEGSEANRLRAIGSLDEAGPLLASARVLRRRAARAPAPANSAALPRRASR
jgi:L-glutamine-phosphate cytidylyltransferase